jgi:hypothetical protein
MAKTTAYENFPARIAGASNAVSLSIYGLGILIMFRVGMWFGIAYVLYIALLEFRLLGYHCTACYYWGKTCGFGKGRLSALFFRKRDPAQFCRKNMTWKDMAPDMAVSLLPFAAGIVLIIVRFDLVILSALLLQCLLTTVGNGFIRGKLTCSFCRQRELGCPAYALFNKENGGVTSEP